MPGSAFGLDDRRDKTPPENASGSAPSARPLCVARIDSTYGSARSLGFEVGSSDLQRTDYCCDTYKVAFFLASVVGSAPNNRRGDRERSVVTRRERGRTVRARGALWALLGGPSTSPSGGSTK